MNMCKAWLARCD